MRTIYQMYKFVMTSERNLPNSSYCFSPCSKKCVNMFTIKFPQLTTVYIHAIRIKQSGKGVTITMRKISKQIIYNIITVCNDYDKTKCTNLSLIL